EPDGTDHTPSAPLLSVIMGGPFWPGAPTWMCATVPSMPEVLMVPETDLSAAIVMVPVPDADVVTGGVSSAPLNFTFISTAKTDPLIATRTVAAASARTLGRWNDLLMMISPEGSIS